MANFAGNSGFDRLNMFPPVIKALLIANVAIFILGFLPGGTFQGEEITMQIRLLIIGGLWPVGSEMFMPWQYVTYLFLHGGFGHVFFNMLALWMFGQELEHDWGSKRFLIYYAACGIGAGLIHSAVTLLMGNEAPTVGASGAIMGVMLAFGLLKPDRIIYVQFFLPLKAKYAVLLFIAIDLFFGFNPGANDNVARFAHLGGALVGFIILLASGQLRLGSLFSGRRSEPHRMPPPAAPPERARVIDVRFRETEPVSNRHAPAVNMNFGSEQERIDAILDKISRTGYQTLTEEEKAILLEASKRIR